jgi:hypothetical protein
MDTRILYKHSRLTEEQIRKYVRWQEKRARRRWRRSSKVCLSEHVINHGTFQDSLNQATTSGGGYLTLYIFEL